MMNISRDEYAEVQREREAAKPKGKPTVPARAMLQDVVAAEHITTEEHWDRYLTWLAATRNAADLRVGALKEVIVGPSCVTFEDLMRAKLDAAQMQGIVTALDWVMEIPVALKKGAAEVRELIKEEESGGE